MKKWIYIIPMLLSVAVSAQVNRPSSGGGSGTVTSVAMTAPTGLTVTGSPVTTSGTLGVSLTSGYSIPTTANQTNWTAGYNDKVNSLGFTGTTTKTLTLTQQDGGTVTGSFTDLYDSVYFDMAGAVLTTKSAIEKVVVNDTIGADVIEPVDSTATYFTSDINVANDIYGDSLFVNYLGGTIGQISTDTLLLAGLDYHETDTVLYISNDTVYKYLAPSGGSGDTSYFDLATNRITTKAGIDEIATDSLILGSDADNVSGVLRFVASDNDMVNVYIDVNDRLYVNGASSVIFGSSYFGDPAINPGAGSGTASHRPVGNANTGLGGTNLVPEIIVSGTPEISTSATSSTFGGSIIRATGTIADNDATPSVSGADIWTYSGTATALTITDLDNPIVGATYTIIGNSDTYTVTIADGGNFNLSAQWVGGVDDVLILYVQADNDYIELGRVDN